MMKALERTRQTLTTPHVEVTLRMTFSMLLAYIFLFADIRWITPINTGRLMAILAVILVMLNPTLMFSFGAVILPTFSTMLYASVCSTMLLAIAVSGGSVAYIVIFGLWAFWMCWLRWDKSVGSRVSITLILVVFMTLLGWPNFLVVQDGFVVPDDYFSDEMNEVLGSYLYDTIDIGESMGIGSHDLIVESGTLEGVSVVVTVNEDKTSLVYVEGGMWLVKGMWTFTGLSNPLAVIQNNLIMICWLMVILGIAVLCPPFRTMRSTVWQRLIPAALKEAANMIHLQVNLLNIQSIKDASGITSIEKGFLESLDTFNNDNDDNDDNEVKETDEPDDEDDIAETRTKILQAKGKGLNHMNTLFNGNLARYTFFEPRLLNCQPIECTASYLSELSHLVGRMVGISLGFVSFSNTTEFSPDEMQYYKVNASNLEVCATALATGDEKLLNKVDLDTKLDHHDVFTMSERVDQITKESRKWLNAMSGTSESSEEPLKSFMMNLKPWIMVHIRPQLLSFQHLLAPFKRSTWSSFSDRGFHKLVWCIKYSVGMSLLIVMSVYWPAYSEGFAVVPDDAANKQLYAIRNGGWVIISYCFATTQTTEGSIKKGTLRFLGTLTGAFSGWLALLACEDSQFDIGYNPYGLTAWMTITSFIAVLAGSGRGFSARIAINRHYGFGPLYFTATQIIIVAYVALTYGPESRNWITVNRLVANCVGIAVSIFLAVLPPRNYGGDPAHARRINHLLWHTIQSILQSLVLSQINLEDKASEIAEHFKTVATTVLSRAADLQETAVDFQKDAERLQTKPMNLPFFRVDERLKDRIANITRCIYITTFIANLVARIIESPDCRKLLLDKDGDVQNELKKILDVMTSSSIQDFKETTTNEFNSKDDTALLIHTIHSVIRRIVEEEHALDDIKWGL